VVKAQRTDAGAAADQISFFDGLGMLPGIRRLIVRGVIRVVVSA
jgi:hypothetical protein